MGFSSARAVPLPPLAGAYVEADTWRAMTQEDVEVVRGIHDAVARRDDVAPFEVYAEDIVWDLSNSARAALYSQPVYRGHEGVRQSWRESLSAFGVVDFEVEKLLDAGEVVVANIRGHLASQREVLAGLSCAGPPT